MRSWIASTEGWTARFNRWCGKTASGKLFTSGIESCRKRALLHLPKESEAVVRALHRIRCGEFDLASDTIFSTMVKNPDDFRAHLYNALSYSAAPNVCSTSDVRESLELYENALLESGGQFHPLYLLGQSRLARDESNVLLAKALFHEFDTLVKRIGGQEGSELSSWATDEERKSLVISEEYSAASSSAASSSFD